MKDLPTPDDQTLAWHDSLLLGYGPIDDTHKEFVEIVQAMQRASDAEFPACLEAFAVHAEAHFGAEDAWMIETEFPPRECHINEHAEVMKSVKEVQALVAQGHIVIGRDLTEELARWFPAHVDYLDSALAQWMSVRRLGAKPVVLKRSMAQ